MIAWQRLSLKMQQFLWSQLLLLQMMSDRLIKYDSKASITEPISP